MSDNVVDIDARIRAEIAEAVSLLHRTNWPVVVELYRGADLAIVEVLTDRGVRQRIWVDPGARYARARAFMDAHRGVEGVVHPDELTTLELERMIERKIA